MTRIIIYTGKGGTGKTVNSCSTAINLAERKYKTLIMSSDPAHTLNDAFITKDIQNEPTKITENLYAVQIDPILEINAHYKPILSYLASVFFSKGIDETLSYEIAMLPGMTQLFSLLKIEELFHHSNYDVIVLDMPASGEALRYLYFPKLSGSISKRLSNFGGLFTGFAKMFQPFAGFYPNSSPAPNVLRDELDLIVRLEKLSKLIIDPYITSLRLIVNPDTFSIENAKRALMSANLYGINVDFVIINKIMPGSSSDNFFANWAKFQSDKVQEAKINFYPLPIREAKLHEKELRGLDTLREHSKSIFKSDDPSNIFYSEKVFEFIREGSELIMKLKVPFTEKDDFNINRIGDQLAIKVKSSIGHITSIIPLPVATIGMKISHSNLVNGQLQVFFESINQ